MITTYPPAVGTLESLVQPNSGLIGRVVQLNIQPGEPHFPIASSSLGDIGQVLPTVARSLEGRSAAGTLDGAGGSLELSEARIRAIAEGLERYSSCAYDERQFRWATAE
jgi:ribosomal protein S12 methylthiotransferase accessory factor